MARVTCPICASPVSSDTSEGRDAAFPFCSMRCKRIDLGAWLDGAYRIPGDPVTDEERDALSKLTSSHGGDA